MTRTIAPLKACALVRAVGSHVAGRVGVLALCLTSALVASPQAHSTPTLRAELFTDVPISMGAGGLVEFDEQWRVFSSFGVMPSAYVGLTNQVVMKIPNTYTEPTAELITQTIQDSLVWTSMLGWSPRSSGFYTHLGYRLVTLGGGSSTAALIEGITGQMIERQRASSGQALLPIEAEATLHMLGLELGWEWPVYTLGEGDQLTLRAALGWSYTFSSAAQLDAGVIEGRPRLNEGLRRLEAEGEAYLTDTFGSYVHPPSVSFAIGYQWR